MKAAFERLIRQAAVPTRTAPDGAVVLVPGDETGLARSLGALLAAGLPLGLEGLDTGEAPRVSLETFSRVVGVRAGDGVVVVEPGTPWSSLEAALAVTPFECPVFPAYAPDAPMLWVAAARVPIRAFHPFGLRAEWVRDLRLVTPEGTVVRSPYSPRRATGPDLRLPALALGAPWGVPTSLTLRLVPRSPRDERVLALPDAAAALAVLERLGNAGDEASFLAEAEVTAKSARVRVVWRQATLREPPADLWSPATTTAWKAPAPGPTVSVRVPWGDATTTWLAALAKARRRPTVVTGVRLWGPDRQGVTVELAGPASLAEAAEAGVLPTVLSERATRLATLRTRLGQGGVA